MLEPRCPVDLSAKETYFSALPHDHLTELRRRSPVFWHEAGGGYWAVLKHADIRTISRDTETFSSKRGGVFYDNQQDSLVGSLILSDPPEHGRLRRFVDEPFATQALQRLEPFLRARSREIMTRAIEKGRCDFVYDLAAELPLKAISEIMDVPEQDRPNLLRLGDEVIRAPSNQQRNDALRALGRYGQQLAQDRRSAAGPGASDLVSLMTRSNRYGTPLSEAEFAGQFAQIAVAANETSRTLLSNIAIELMNRPDLFAELQGNPSLLPSAIEEFLRWVTPIYYMRRTATRNVELGGATVGRGDKVVMYYLSANRDEDVFDEPFSLDIRRRPNRHLAFGSGPHVCLGQFLARLETRVFLEEFLAKVAAMKPDGLPRRLPSNITNSWDCIPVSLQAR